VFFFPSLIVFFVVSWNEQTPEGKMDFQCKWTFTDDRNATEAMSCKKGDKWVECGSFTYKRKA
jgi:hypothetical protein